MVTTNTFLKHRVAVTYGYGVIFQRFVVDGNTIGGADRVLAAVSSSDSVFFVVLAHE